jgi:hypothetical protein
MNAPEVGSVLDQIRARPASNTVGTPGETYSNTAQAQRSAPLEAVVQGTAARLETVEAYIRRFVVMSDEEHAMVSLWTLLTYVYRSFYAIPYLNVSSPMEECGKTRLFEALSMVVHHGDMQVIPTAATIFRSIEVKDPTLLLDEIDMTLGKKAEDNTELIAVLNAGYRSGAAVPRNVGNGSSMKVVNFPVFCPKALAGINEQRIPQQTLSRCIPIRLERKTPEQKVERFRESKEVRGTEAIRDGLSQWAVEVGTDLKDADEPVFPEELSDRQQDIWEPLLVIADLAGGTWPARARQAALVLHKKDEMAGYRTRLLRACRDAFGDQDRSLSRTLITALASREDGEWAGWWGETISRALRSESSLYDHDGVTDGLWRKLGSRLAHELAPFDGIGPKKIRVGEETGQGYTREMFEPHWARYLLDEEPSEEVTP